MGQENSEKHQKFRSSAAVTPNARIPPAPDEAARRRPYSINPLQKKSNAIDTRAAVDFDRGSAGVSVRCFLVFPMCPGRVGEEEGWFVAGRRQAWAARPEKSRRAGRRPKMRPDYRFLYIDS